MKKQNDLNEKNNINDLMRFLSENKLVSLIAGKKLLKGFVKKPLRTLTTAVIAGYIAALFLKKKK